MSQPLELCLRIIELRQYARTKEAVERAKSDEQMPDGPMAALAFEFQHRLIKERQAKKAEAVAAYERQKQARLSGQAPQAR